MSLDIAVLHLNEKTTTTNDWCPCMTVSFVIKKILVRHYLFYILLF